MKKKKQIIAVVSILLVVFVLGVYIILPKNRASELKEDEKNEGSVLHARKEQHIDTTEQKTQVRKQEDVDIDLESLADDFEDIEQITNEINNATYESDLEKINDL